MTMFLKALCHRSLYKKYVFICTYKWKNLVSTRLFERCLSCGGCSGVSQFWNISNVVGCWSCGCHWEIKDWPQTTWLTCKGTAFIRFCWHGFKIPVSTSTCYCFFLLLLLVFLRSSNAHTPALQKAWKARFSWMQCHDGFLRPKVARKGHAQLMTDSFVQSQSPKSLLLF